MPDVTQATTTATTTVTQSANPQQLQAITTTDGPLLIIAGPGSGKTFTLVERIVHLITTHSVTPEQVMVVTFTEKALSCRIVVLLISSGTLAILNSLRPINGRAW